MHKRQSVIALSFAASLALATVAGAAETKKEADAKPITLKQIFAEVAADNLVIASGPHGFVITKVTTPEVVLVRREADGTRSAACVNNEKAAREFFNAPARKPAKAEKE
jgi:hypothetical protein